MPREMPPQKPSNPTKNKKTAGEKEGYEMFEYDTRSWKTRVREIEDRRKKLEEKRQKEGFHVMEMSPEDAELHDVVLEIVYMLSNSDIYIDAEEVKSMLSKVEKCDGNGFAREELADALKMYINRPTREWYEHDPEASRLKRVLELARTSIEHRYLEEKLQHAKYLLSHAKNQGFIPPRGKDFPL